MEGDPDPAPDPTANVIIKTGRICDAEGTICVNIDDSVEVILEEKEVSLIHNNSKKETTMVVSAKKPSAPLTINSISPKFGQKTVGKETLVAVNASKEQGEDSNDLQDASITKEDGKMSPSKIKRVLPMSPTTPRAQTTARRDYKVLYEELKHRTLGFTRKNTMPSLKSTNATMISSQKSIKQRWIATN